MRMTEGQLRRIVREELREMKGVTMSVEDKVAEYIRTHFVPGRPLVLPAHLARMVAGPSISGMEGPGAQAAMKAREPQIRGFTRLEDIELGSEFGEEEEEDEYDRLDMAVSAFSRVVDQPDEEAGIMQVRHMLHKKGLTDDEIERALSRAYEL